MRPDSPGWAELVRRLAADFLELLSAETDQIGRDLRPSLLRLRRSAVLFAVALFLAFWILGLVAAALVLLLAGWLPAWGAALAVAGALLLVTAVLVAIGVFALKRLDNPVRVASDRFRDHLAWWSNTASAALAGEAGDDAGEERG